MLTVKAILILAIIQIILCTPFDSAEPDDDIIDLSNITVFPEYDHTIRAGYLNLTAYNQAFYYLFC